MRCEIHAYFLDRSTARVCSETKRAFDRSVYVNTERVSDFRPYTTLDISSRKPSTDSDSENLLMETEQRYLDEPSIPEFCTNTYNPSPSEKNMIPEAYEVDMLINEYYMLEYSRNFWPDEHKKTLISQQLESSQSTESTIPIKQEEDNWFETHLMVQEMFPELANIYIPDALHGVETILPEPQEELHDVKPALAEPCKELHDVETTLAESQIIKEETVEIKEENACKKLNNVSLKTEIKIEEEINIETEIMNEPTTSQKALESLKRNASTKKVNLCSKKRKLKTENVVTKTKQEEQKENVDIDSISNITQGKVIEAVDLSSLLEKFEEMEKLAPLPNLHNKPTIKDIPSHRAKSTKKTQNRPIKQQSYQNNVPKKSLKHTSNQHNVNSNSSQKPAEMTKIPESKKIVPNSVKNVSSINIEHDYCIVYTDNSSVKNDHISKAHTSKDTVTTKEGNIPTGSSLSNKQPNNHSWTNINSALARNILKSRQKIEVQTGSKVQQMVSVLKKPPNPLPNSTKQCSLPNNMKESIMTITNSSSGEIQNIIQQNTQENMPLQNIKQPVRKIGLAEYREKQRLLMKNTKPLVQKKVVYTYNASTMTASSLEDSSKNEDRKDWSMREIDTVIISETEKQKKKEFCNAFTQTYKTIFEFSKSSTENERDNIAESISERANVAESTNERDNVVESTSEKPSIAENTNKRDNVVESANESGSTQTESSTKRKSRSRSKSRNKSKTRTTSKSKNKSTHKKRRIERKHKSKNRHLSTSSSRSRSDSRSRSRSNSHSHHHKYNRRRSRDSSSSSSSCTSNTRSRKRSRSSSYNSKSPSRYYSRRSRSPSASRSKRSRRWSSDRERQYDRDQKYRRESRKDRDLRRSPPQYSHRPYNERTRREWQRQVEERRVVYVGGIEDGTTKAELRKRFEKFGRIVEVSLHFRTQAINFGFVTFEYKDDAYKAVEHGNDGQALKYHLSFGGRRAFCQVNYADLDGSGSSYGNSNSPVDNSSFDDLLQQALNRQKLV
ncbi:pinin isoform X2 [Odontomachus brunneus]|uniref:pinin isoform X2 n=1 Tax=Odontomachus brunneus TaxID=486640 RepID=UPI0013F256BB|nr:pinin isoform X2 [Odontomachus brunneus]